MPALAHLIVDEQGFAWLPEEDSVSHFASDGEASHAKVMCAVQQGLSMSTFEDVMSVPAWKSLPTWYLVATNDEAIPPDARRTAHVRAADGGDHDRGPFQPPGDGVPPGRGGAVDRGGGERAGSPQLEPRGEDHANDRCLRHQRHIRGPQGPGARPGRHVDETSNRFRTSRCSVRTLRHSSTTSRMGRSRMSRETATTSGCKCSPTRGRSIVKAALRGPPVHGPGCGCRRRPLARG